MESSLIVNALGIVIYVAAPIVLAALLGALIVGVLRVALLLDDPVIGFTGRLLGVGISIYFIGASSMAKVLEFTSRLWGGADFYF